MAKIKFEGGDVLKDALRDLAARLKVEMSMATFLDGQEVRDLIIEMRKRKDGVWVMEKT